MNRLLSAVVALVALITVASAANWPSTPGTTATGVVLENGTNGTAISPNAAGQLSVNTEGLKTTYSFAFGPQTAFAAATTDWLTVTGSATKTVKIGKLSVCGTATAATTIDVLLIKRSTADTGGTVSSTPSPVAHDSANAAATSAVVSYSANPTTGAVVGNVDVKKWNLGALGAAGCIFWQWGDTNGQEVTLRGVAQQLAVNFAGIAPPAGASFDAKVELTEE